MAFKAAQRSPTRAFICYRAIANSLSLDLNYDDAVEFANGILADAAKHKEYRPSAPTERLINLARSFLKPSARAWKQ
jgi:hypothetical protein